MLHRMSSTMVHTFSMFVVVLAHLCLAAESISEDAQRAFNDLEKHNNDTAGAGAAVTATVRPRAEVADPVIREFGEYIRNAKPSEQAYLYRMMHAYIKNQQRRFPAQECLSHKCAHGNRRYNCGKASKGNTVRTHSLTRSRTGSCIGVDMRQHTHNGQVCYAELWLNNAIIRDLLRGSVAEQQGVVTVSGSSLSRPLSFAMNASAKMTHRWAMMDVPEIVASWSEDDQTTNQTYDVCWRPDVGEETKQFPALRLRRLHAHNLNLSDVIDHKNSKSFFQFGVIPREKPTLPSPPKVVSAYRPPQPRLISPQSAFAQLRPGRPNLQIAPVRRSQNARRLLPLPSR